MDVSAALVDRRFQLFEIVIEMSERVFFDALGMIARRIDVGQRRVPLTIASHQRAGQTPQRRLQRRIRQCLLDSGEKIMMFVLCIAGHACILTGMDVPSGFYSVKVPERSKRG
jgi:hypothetical protein